MSNENLHKEIDLIQNCINRMANNSFLLKGWAISLIAVVLALTEDRGNPLFLFGVVLIPLFCFWYLDGFFLQAEKRYRKMYDWVLEQRKQGNDEFQYNLDPKRFKDEVESLFCTMLSETLRVYYGVPILVVIGVIVYQIAKTYCS